MLQAATIYNLSQTLNPEEFGKLMRMYDRDKKSTQANVTQAASLPTVEETVERLLAGPMRTKRNPIHKNK